MNRRDFLHSGAFSLTWLSLPAPGFLSATGPQTTDVYRWLQQWSTAIGARRYISLWNRPENLREQIDQTNRALARQGFLKQDSRLFFCENPALSSHCFYPLEQRHAVAGFTEILVPVLVKQPNGAWNPIKVLAGYEIEALARAAVAMETPEKRLSDWLLPTGPTMLDSHTFPTKQGRVRIETQLTSDVVTTHIQVFRESSVEYEARFASQHCLRCAPVGQNA